MAHDVADVCLVGVGTVGGLLAKELATAGLRVVGLERGPALALEDYAARDAIRFVTRRSLQEWVRDEPTAFRSLPNERATLRHAAPPINALGGASIHWTANSARFLPGDFRVFSNEVDAGAADRAGADLSGYDIVDWPLTYDHLEPYYERFEWEFGVSGRAGGNPSAGPRRRDYPLPPLRSNGKVALFEAACRRLGYHPFHSAAGILSEPYRPPEPYDTRIPERPACVYCAHCSSYGCHVNAKAATLYTVIPVALQTGNLDLRTGCKVFRINTDGAGRATGVSYFDPEGQVQEQRARLVITAGYTFENTRLLLVSGNDSGKVGRGIANSSGMVGKGIAGLCDVHVHGLFDDYIINSFIGPIAGGMRIDDFNGNSFDHTGLGFIRGGGIGGGGGGTPVERIDLTPPGMRGWGKEYKEYFARYYTRTLTIGITMEVLPHRDNMIDLNPDSQDAWGVPHARATFSFHTNERRMHPFMAEVGERIMRETGAGTIWSKMPGQTARGFTGGTRMGSDPRTSVVNDFCQSHDIPNLFVVGSSVFPTATSSAATTTISALAYRTAEYIVRQREWFR